jgi:hypothetical protein
MLPTRILAGASIIAARMIALFSLVYAIDLDQPSTMRMVTKAAPHDMPDDQMLTLFETLPVRADLLNDTICSI